MIKSDQHGFPNKILVKIENFCEKLDKKSSKIAIF
jgi:hypothetical protein